MQDEPSNNPFETFQSKAAGSIGIGGELVGVGVEIVGSGFNVDSSLAPIEDMPGFAEHSDDAFPASVTHGSLQVHLFAPHPITPA